MARFWSGARKTVNLDSAAVEPVRAEPAPPRSSERSAVSKGEALQLVQNYEDSAQGWFWSTDADGCVTYLSASVASLLISGGAALGSPFVQLFRPGDEHDEAPRTLPFIVTKRARFDRLMLRAAQGADDRWWSVSGCPQFDGGGSFIGYRGSAVDVTEQRKSSEKAASLAMYDALTGLPNRRRMADSLETSLVALELQKRSCAVMLIDLDRFKAVNDTLGHPAGDALLKQVAERLLRIVGDHERVFRLGGDEFQIIVRDCDDRGTLGDLANHIIANLSQPYSVGGSRCIIGASVGVAISPFDGRSSDELIRNADLALYAAKEGGRGRFRFFSAELLAAAEDRRLLEEDLRDALARDEIKLFYQPIVDAVTNCTTGVEALVRWQHPERGWISPALFIPIAEEANLIERLGEWVLRQACEDAVRWPGKLRVAVNVSPIQFTNDAFADRVLAALAASGLAPERLELEITEGVFLSDSAATDVMFATLKDIGVRLALDDFGTGYSSLSYLRTAPFDKIKIDQSFVRAATLPRSRNPAIIAAIVALAEALGMETTAEGIESHDQLDLVRRLRVSHVQGWIYSKAISSADMNAALGAGDWTIAPVGPAKQRSDRHSMYRTVGAIFGNAYRSVLIRNLSATGALLDGLVDVPVGSLVLIDFGEGQLAFARVRRSRKGQCGIEFEQQLVSDGNGSLCTRGRVAPYVLAKAGLPSADTPGVAATAADANVLEQFRGRLGLNLAPGLLRSSAPTMSGTGPNDGPAASPPLAAASPGPKSTTIHELSDRYLDYVRGDRERYAIDARCLNEDILPRFGPMRTDDLAPSQIADWLAAKVKDEGYPPAKVSRLQGIMGQMYVLAMQWGMAGADAGRSEISVFGRTVHERSLTPEEIERVNTAVQASPTSQLRHIVALLMLTGTRQRELLAAQWQQIDLDARLWRVPISGPAGTKSVPLSPAAIAVLEKLPRCDENQSVIINPKTKRPYRSISASWDAARKKAGLPDVELDDLRHSVGATDQSSGASPPAVRDLLARVGH